MMAEWTGWIWKQGFRLFLVCLLAVSSYASAQAKREMTKEEIEQLNALGYTATASKDSTKAGVTRIDENAVCPGFRLYIPGAAPLAELIDAKGNTIHKWQMNPWDVEPGFERVYPVEPGWFSRARMLDDGSLLAIFGAIGIVKLNKNSEVLWRVQNRAHHALDIAENGDIYVLRHYTRVIPRLYKDEPAVDDLIAILDSEGREKDAISILEAIENSREFAYLWENHARRAYKPRDILHPNSITILDGANAQQAPAFKKGNLLVSVAFLNALVVIDPATRELVWAHQGPYKIQHDPSVLDNGNLLVFDNRGIAPHSRVIEFTLPSMEIAWSFCGTDQVPFASDTCGTCQRLPNGNTLIVESNGGRAFEVTPKGDIVWEFYNPHRTQENKITKIYMMTWLPAGVNRFWE